MHMPCHRCLPLPWLVTVAWTKAPASEPKTEKRSSKRVWSLGLRPKMNDMRQPGQLGLHPMIGLRYGRWPTGVVDGENWHRFGRIVTNNTLTCDPLDSTPWRTSPGPSVTYRPALTDSRSILLSQSFTRGKSDFWRYSAQLAPSVNLGQSSHWGTSMSTSGTLRQRWKARWSWFAQTTRSQTLQSGDPLAREGQSNRASQIGLVYFQR